jgi:inner membrane protein
LDNVTHTLAGLLMAEAAVQLRSKGGGRVASSWRTAAYVVSASGNNLPDLDFVYSGITPRPLGYLLHHRGHSHTVVAAFAFALVTLGLAAVIARWRRLSWSRGDWRWIAALSILAPLVHIGMDFSNNYGVHPFWPIYDGWMYGDAVFIVEPFFWAAAIPPLFFAVRAASTRSILAAVLVLGLGLCWALSFVPFGIALALTLLAIATTVASWRAGPAMRIAIGVCTSLAIVLTFFAASHAAKAAIKGSPVVAERSVDDIIATPLPANPLCFAVLVVGTRGNDYSVVRATVATMPGWVSADRCPRDPDEHPTAPFVPIAEASTPAILYRGEFVAPRTELSRLARDNCQAAALLRFARAPYWVDEITGDTILGDLRYDRHPDLDFSDIRLAAHPAWCPSPVPPWIPPRKALLEGN